MALYPIRTETGSGQGIILGRISFGNIVRAESNNGVMMQTEDVKIGCFDCITFPAKAVLLATR